MIEDLGKAFAKYWGAYHIGSKSKTSEARKRKEQRKKSKNRRLNASSYEPDIYGIQQIDSVDEHYFYSHQKPTKLVYEIRLIVLWGKLETSSWFLLYIGSAQLIRTYVFLKIGFW